MEPDTLTVWLWLPGGVLLPLVVLLRLLLRCCHLCRAVGGGGGRRVSFGGLGLGSALLGRCRSAPGARLVRPGGGRRFHHVSPPARGWRGGIALPCEQRHGRWQRNGGDGCGGNEPSAPGQCRLHPCRMRGVHHLAAQQCRVDGGRLFGVIGELVAYVVCPVVVHGLSFIVVVVVDIRVSCGQACSLPCGIEMPMMLP